MPVNSVILPEQEEEEINLRTVQIEETDDSEEEVAKGRPSNVTVEEFSWSDNRTEIDIPGFSQAVGPTTILPVGALALDFFVLFMSNRILQNILRETNRYASHTLQAKNKDPTTWKQLSMEELKAFFGLLVAMSIHKLPCLRDYWSSDWVLSVPAFSRIMPRNRFLDIWNNIHLCDNMKMPKPGDSNFDKLFKLRQFIDDLKTNFQINYAPHREKAVDEAMIKYKGRTSLKQYMPMKPIKRGIKMWCRADITNGYLCDFFYTGKTQQGVQHGLGYSVVTKLCETIKGHWYAIFFVTTFLPLTN